MSRLCSAEVAVGVEVTTVVEKIVVNTTVSNTVDVVIAVSVVNAMLFCGKTRVVSCICCLVKTTVRSTVATFVTIAVFVVVIDWVFVFVAAFAVLMDVNTVVEVLRLLAESREQNKELIHSARNNDLTQKRRAIRLGYISPSSSLWGFRRSRRNLCKISCIPSPLHITTYCFSTSIWLLIRRRWRSL